MKKLLAVVGLMGIAVLAGGTLFYFGSCDNERILPELEAVNEAHKWKHVLTASKERSFHDVWGSGPRNIWAVGNSVYRFDGTRWTDLSERFRSWLPLERVGGGEPGNVYFRNKRGQLLRLHSDKVQPVRVPISVSEFLITPNGVFYLTGIGKSKKRLFATGRPGAWKLFEPDQKLLSLAPIGTDNDVWIVSSYYGHRTRIHHHDGQRWTAEGIGMATAFNAWYAGTGHPVVYVHSVDNFPKRRTGSSTFGSSWERLVTKGMEKAKLVDVWSNGPEDVWAYGGVESQTAIFRFNGRRWQKLLSGIDFSGARLWAHPTGLAVVVQDDGALFLRTP